MTQPAVPPPTMMKSKSLTFCGGRSIVINILVSIYQISAEMSLKKSVLDIHDL